MKRTAYVVRTPDGFLTKCGTTPDFAKARLFSEARHAKQSRTTERKRRRLRQPDVAVEVVEVTVTLNEELTR